MGGIYAQKLRSIGGGTAISTSLGAVFHYLLKHPSEYCKLVNEIKRRNKAGYISSYVASSQSKEMPYLSVSFLAPARTFS